MTLKFDYSTGLHIIPQTDKNTTDIQQLLKKAKATSPVQIKSLDILYVMDIQHYQTKYSAFVIDSHGIIHKFTWSAKRVVDMFFRSKGFSYQIWEKFLKIALNRPRSHFPYVHGACVFIRIPVPGHHNEDWLNLSKIDSLNLMNSVINPRSKLPEPEAVIFECQLSNKNKSQCRITLTKRLTKIIRQIILAMHFAQRWNDFINSQNQQNQSFLHLTYKNEPMPPVFSHIELRKHQLNLITTGDLEFFSEYTKRVEFMDYTHTTTNQPVFPVVNENPSNSSDSQ